MFDYQRVKLILVIIILPWDEFIILRTLASAQISNIDTARH
jgi:hypothetical protein